MLLRVDSTSAADTATITADGEVDLATVNTLRSALTEAMQQGATHVTLDLDRVTYIDSSGLGVLVGAHKRLKAQGRALVLRVANAEMIKLIKLTGLDQLFALEMPYGEAGNPAASQD